MKLKDMGFDPWFEAHADELHQKGCRFARISAVDRGSFRIKDELGEVPAELSGKLSYQTESPADLPCVGDWVTAQYYDNDTEAIIHLTQSRSAPRVKARIPRLAGSSSFSIRVRC